MNSFGGNSLDGTYSLIFNPGFADNNGKPIFQTGSGKYLYSFWNQYWLVGDDYTTSSSNQYTASGVDCPTDLTAWSVTCSSPLPPAAPSPSPLPPNLPNPQIAPPSPPPFMGYEWDCPCSEVELTISTATYLDGTYSLIHNPGFTDNRGKPVSRPALGSICFGGAEGGR